MNDLLLLHRPRSEQVVPRLGILSRLFQTDFRLFSPKNGSSISPLPSSSQFSSNELSGGETDDSEYCCEFDEYDCVVDFLLSSLSYSDIFSESSLSSFSNTLMIA